MRHTMANLVTMFLALLPFGVGAQEDPYRQALAVEQFRVHVFTSDGDPGTAMKNLAADESIPTEVRVRISNYLPRALEPVLVINGQPVPTRSRIISAEGDITEIGFLLIDSRVLDVGVEIAVQMGAEQTTRSSSKLEFSRELIEVLDTTEISKLSMDAPLHARTRY